jgi:hypothetical protein
MTKVLIKHKDGSLSGPHEVDLDRGIQIKTRWICRTVIEALGLEVIPYEEPRRECWIHPNSIDTLGKNTYSAAIQAEQGDNSSWIKVVHLREGEVIVSREKFAEAWDKVGALTKSSCSGTFRELCEELGLE